MQADDRAGPARSGGELGDRQGGGVRGEQGPLGQQRVERGEQLPLAVHALGDRLDHQLTLRQGGQVRGGRDAGEQRGRLAVGQLAVAYGPTGRGGQVAVRAFEPGGVALDTDHLQARAGEHLGDASTHGAEPDHADLRELAHHRCSCPSTVTGQYPRFRRSGQRALRTVWACPPPCRARRRSPAARR